jgi:GTP cyclohydrolase II
MHVPARVIRPQSHTSLTSQWMAATKLPTKHGTLTTHVFRSESSPASRDGRNSAPISVEHVALVHGDVSGRTGVPVRVHSECLTSEVFGSLKCDCRDQLDWALGEIVRRGAGAVLYLRQEGRGIGLANKIRAYELQATGLDTVDANRSLGLPDDARRYDVARDMLDHLGIQSVRLMTNNPDKVSALRGLGVSVLGRIPVIVPATAFSRGYLEAKRDRMSHELPTYGEGHVEALAAGDAE